MALHGIRVCDLSRLLPGPWATQMLVDLGADVIKVEEPTIGDPAREYFPRTSDNTSLIFHALNRGKKSVTLNLKEESGRTSLLKLISTCDILVEQFRPGVLSNLGISVDFLRESYPALIICSISGYGQSGAYSLRSGHDINYVSRAGILGELKDPVALPIQAADIAGGSFPAVIQILAALYRRKETGAGTYIDISMCSNVYSMSVLSQSEILYRGAGESHDHILSGSFPCYRIYSTKDGYISVGALESKYWKRLVDLLDLSHLVDCQYSSGEIREKTIEILSTKFQSRTNAEWSLFLQNNDVMCEIVMSPLEASEEAISRGDVLDVNIPLRRSLGSPYETIYLPKTPLTEGANFSHLPGPSLGEHNFLLSSL